MTKILDDLIGTVESSFDPDTPEYEIELRRLKVLKCQEMQNVVSCTDCPRFHDCELRISHWQDIYLGES